MIKIAIIDDNESIRKALVNMIEYNFPDQLEIVEASGVVEGFNLLTDESVKIVLLDVEMDDGTGIELMKSFGDFSFYLIFVSGHKEYAVNAIKLKAFDYLLKPVNPLELITVMRTALQKIELCSNDYLHSDGRILVKSHETTTIVNPKEIVRCEANGGYTKVFLNDGGHLLSSKNLRYFEDRLDNSIYLRVHHAHLVNSMFIKEVSRHKNNGILLKNGERIPISVRKISIMNDFLLRFEKGIK